MLSYSFKISEEKSVSLRLTSRGTVVIEDKLGMSPIEALMENIPTDAEKQKMPKLNTMIVILHGCLQSLEHGYTEEKTYDLYDEYVDNGGTLMELIMVLVEVFKVSGFFKTPPVVEDQAVVVLKKTGKK